MRQERGDEGWRGTGTKIWLFACSIKMKSRYGYKGRPGMDIQAKCSLAVDTHLGISQSHSAGSS